MSKKNSADSRLADGELLQQIPLALAVSLFDRLPDVVFFAKDAAGRYTHANRTLAARLGLSNREHLIGRQVEALFPRKLGDAYAAQDRRVLERGIGVIDQLEVHLLPGGGRGWCLTCKHPLRSAAGSQIIGLVGLSRDLPRLPESNLLPAAISAVVQRILRDYDQPLRIAQLAESAGISMDQLERRMRQLLGLGPRQLLVRTRIEAAIVALAGQDSVAAVALASGYSDQSAFSRQFKAVVGISPRAYRARVRSE